MTEKGGLRGGGRETGPKEGGICIHIADSLHCTAETNTTLLSNYTAIINKQTTTKKKKKDCQKFN